MLNEIVIQLCKQYSQGERQFQNLQLENANLAKASLSKIDLSNSKLDNINLGQADLSHASLIECSLVRANLSRANLAGAYFFGVDLSLADVRGAIYDKHTSFPASFDPIAAGMIQQGDTQELNLNKLLVYFNELYRQSQRYLGPTISSKYFNDSRPEFDWLNQFQINGNREIYFTKGVLSFANPEQAKHFRQWIDSFIVSCSKVIKNFPDLESDNDDNDDGESLFGGFS